MHHLVHLRSNWLRLEIIPAVYLFSRRDTEDQKTYSLLRRRLTLATVAATEILTMTWKLRTRKKDKLTLLQRLK